MKRVIRVKIRDGWGPAQYDPIADIRAVMQEAVDRVAKYSLPEEVRRRYERHAELVVQALREKEGFLVSKDNLKGGGDAMGRSAEDEGPCD